MVEKGNHCVRGNENQVDINRNWDFEWKEYTSTDFPGKKAFSEIETQFLRDSVKSFQPLVFLSIHSGVLGLFYPYAFNPDNSENQRKKRK